jgi:hypothetical protein
VEERSGKEHSALLASITDWDAFFEELMDMALTTDKFMIAGQCKGDYHDNFDTKSFFKWMVSFMLTYPTWCQEMQTQLDGDVNHVLFRENESPFFDWAAYEYFNF